MTNYLLEIGTEELPAYYVSEACERLQGLMAEALASANLPYEQIKTMGTPRRLTVIVSGLADKQPTVEKKVKGPPVKSGFDAEGKALPPVVGFAAKQGIAVDELAKEEIGGVTYVVANLTITGQSAAAVLKVIVPELISKLSGERLMRWGNFDTKFSRPIRWLVSILDSEVVPFALENLTAGRISLGHRILAPGPVEIKNVSAYVDALRQAKVLVDQNERKSTIEKMVVDKAKTISGRPRKLSGPLLAEVVNLNEWPTAVLGGFEDAYLDLPDELIETVMVHHQRYFPVERLEGTGTKRLLPNFITIANNDNPSASDNIRLGNERVLKARLADGRFFYFDDQKTKLSARSEGLSHLTFQEGLGSYADKTTRLTHACEKVAKQLQLDAKTAAALKQTLEFCKLDLVTSLVRELPELQGYVGSWYAEKEGCGKEVVAAICSHYQPRHQDDVIPADKIGQLASIIDKLDNLTGIFALGKRPSGSSDPYILRRQAQAVVEVLVDGLSGVRLNVSELMDWLSCQFEPLIAKLPAKLKPSQSCKQSLDDLKDFLLQRLKIKLLEKGFAKELVEAVLSVKDPFADLQDVIDRLQCLSKLMSCDDGVSLVRVGVRVGNILTADSFATVNPQLLQEEAEKELWDSFNNKVAKQWQSNGKFREPASLAEYNQMVNLLVTIAPAIDKLFDQVMVNDPDAEKRNNRHAVLTQINKYFQAVAHFPKLQPLLP
jgi:glycyl-tRNA synthetase beta chain